MIRSETAKDGELMQLLHWIRQGNVSRKTRELALMTDSLRTYIAQFDSLHEINGILFRYRQATQKSQAFNQIVIPASLRELALSESHDSFQSGHFGFYKTKSTFQRFFYWAGYKEQLFNYVGSCQVCFGRRGPAARKSQTRTSIFYAQPMDCLFLDVIHLPYGGGKYKYILTCVDAFSRWPEAFPLERISTKIILQVLQTQVFARFGVPKVIKTDNATYFKSRMWKEVIKFLRIHHPDKIAYRPQSRGVVENFNRYIQDALAKFLHQDQRVIWPDLLPLILLAFRNSTHLATGFSPAQLFLGHPLRTPSDNLIAYPPDKSTTSYSQVFKLRRRT